MDWQNFTCGKIRFLKCTTSILFIFLTFPSMGFCSNINTTKNDTEIAKHGGQVLISLKELGKTDGIHFSRAEVGHETKLGYTVPHDTNISSASIHLHYNASSLLSQRSNIQLLVNGHLLKQVPLTDEQYRSEFEVDIPVNLIQPGILNVTIKVTLLTANNRYPDSRASESLLHIDANSTLSIGYQGNITSLRDAWILLPEEVIITVPDRSFSEDEFNAVWGIIDYLYRQGKRIVLTHFPEIGHIDIGDRQSLKKQLLQELNSTQLELENVDSLQALDDDSTIMLLNNPLRSVISITRPTEISASALMNTTWQKLVAGRQYNILTVGDSKIINRSATDVRELKLIDFGMDASTRYMWANTEWRILLDPFLMPAGTRPTGLFLDLMVPPPSNEATFSLYAYLNDIMVYAQHLDGSDGLQHLQIPLPSGYQQLFNKLRIQIMNTALVKDSSEHAVTTFPVQLLPESTLLVERNTAEPKRFVDLPAYLAEQFDIYLPAHYLDSPAQSLLFAAAFTANFPVPFAERKAVFVEADDLLTPTRPFIALGDVEFSELDAPVGFEQGVIEVRDRKDESLLKVSELSGIAIAQLVTSNGQHGLWLRSGDNDPYPDVRRLFLNEDDVAFADRNGLLFSLNSTEPTLARIHYPSSRDWLATIGEYRFWIMVFVWLLLVLGIIYLFKQQRQQQSNNRKPV